MLGLPKRTPKPHGVPASNVVEEFIAPEEGFQGPDLCPDGWTTIARLSNRVQVVVIKTNTKEFWSGSLMKGYAK
jgi:hypothetical protein